MFLHRSRLALLAFVIVALMAALDVTEAKCHNKKHCSAKKNNSHANAKAGNGGLSASLTTSTGGQPSKPKSNKKASPGNVNLSINININGAVPPRGKAGVAGGQALKWIGSSLSWFIDWTAHPDNNEYAVKNNLTIVPMLWGAGRLDHDDDKKRFAAFKKLKPGDYQYVAGFNEADFQGGGSSGVVPPKEAAQIWDQYLGPHQDAGSKLISPSCAKQKDEDWMKPFLAAAKHQPDIIAVHIFQDQAEKVKPVLDHYAQYGKPMWITEFACINYQVSPARYCSQKETDDFLWQTIQIFENDSRVAAYAVSDANNGPNSPLTANHQGNTLTQTGRTFLQALKQLTRRRRRSVDSATEALDNLRLHKRSKKWDSRSEHSVATKLA